MNVASTDIGNRLFELSVWEGTYDAGYLLRKLPQEYTDDVYGVLYLTVGACGASEYQAEYDCYGRTRFTRTADTPEDALTLLAIALFEQGILVREQSNTNKEQI